MLGQMIIPIITDSGSGPSDPLMYAALLIFVNIVCFTIFAIRGIIWFIKRPNYNFGYPTVKKGPSFWEYTIWSGCDDFIPDFVTMFWGGFNGLAIVIYGSWLIYHLLGGTIPFA